MLGSLRAGRLRICSHRVGSALRRLAAPCCAVCQVEPGDPVCEGCLRDFFDESCTRCAVCAGRLASPPASPPGSPRSSACSSRISRPESPLRCGRCLSAAPCFDRTLALGDYVPPLDGMLSALKSGGRLDLAHVFGRLLAARAAAIEPFDCVVAVPLDPGRLRQRGFNQSLQIAATVARALAVPLRRNALVRTRRCRPQQSLPLRDRARNVRAAFGAPGAHDARRVAVVDDVMTSGATLDEVARVLKGAGVGQVVNLVVARTP